MTLEQLNERARKYRIQTNLAWKQGDVERASDCNEKAVYFQRRADSLHQRKQEEREEQDRLVQNVLRRLP